MIMGMCIGCSPYNAEQTVITQAIAVLRRFGQDAHIYLPGVGMLNGLQAGNHLDSAGTTDAEIDGPVGLVLDAAGSLGVELAVNGDFSDGLTGYTTIDTAPGSSTVSNGQLVMSSGDGTGTSRVRRGYQVVIGKTYKVGLDVGYSGSSPTLFYGTTSGGGEYSIVSITSGGDKSFVFTATSTTFWLSLYKTGLTASSAIFDNISVREVTGIHAQQPTTASKPILRRGAVNLLTYSGDFSNAAWAKLNIGAVGSTLTVGSVGNYARQAYTVTASTAYTFAFYAKRGTLTDLNYSVFNFTGGSDIVATTSYYEQTNDTQDALIVVQFTTPVGCTSAAVYVLRNIVSLGTMLCSGAALFAGTYTAAQIQALGGIPLTLTAPASTALGNTYWSFDGSNDSLALGGPLFQSSDDNWCVVAVNVPAAAGDKYMANLASGAGTQLVSSIAIKGSSNFAQAAWLGDSGPPAVILSNASLAGVTTVLTAFRRAGFGYLRINGVQFGAPVSLSGVASATVSGGVIGGFNAANTSNQGAGNMYFCNGGKGSPTDAELLLIEKYAANIAGVQI